ncbi:MAG: hypothetical protein FWD29_05975 [Micrococcales bacterium]|nr:hypothetical protein [Micrococcales bacterium]
MASNDKIAVQLSSTDFKRLASGAREAVAQATELLRQKAAPQLGAAVDWASPRAQTAWHKGMSAAAPKVAEAAAILGPKVDDARDVIVEKALPAIVAAVDNAARAAAQAVEPAKPKSRKGRKLLVISALLAVFGAVVYALWRRTQPLEDPWAEDDFESGETAPEENLAGAAGDAADAVGQAAGTTVKKVTEAAKKAADATKKAAKQLTEHDKAEPEEAKDGE